MLSINRYALKEWAVVCEALATGQQTLLLRKGGIAEQSGRFQVEQPEFWLFPTRFHQSDEELTPHAAPLLEVARQAQPPDGVVRLSLYAAVGAVRYLDEEALLSGLVRQHILSHQTTLDRFHYRKPGLFVLLMRIWKRPQPIEIPDLPHYAGCHSWVELPAELATEGLQPVLSDAEFDA
ncbi:unnamed protein product, partial [marine sediment metagenome]